MYNRERYESALREVQESLDLQTTSTGEQLSQLQEQLKTEREKFSRALAEHEHMSEEVEDEGKNQSVVEELARLKKALGEADAEVISNHS